MGTDPDNYTDQATFLENLQRNPRLKPYDFWPLVTDSTVILQHVCSVLIFVVCFVGIFQDRVSPVSVVSWSSVATFLGWILWERWVSEEEDLDGDAVTNTANTGPTTGAAPPPAGAANALARGGGSLRRRNRAASLRRPLPPFRPDSGLFTANPSAASSSSNLLPARSQTASTTSLGSLPLTSLPRINSAELSMPPEFEEESRVRQRLGTIKSALLIYCTLLGLSPILKSLTRSTSSDSIWAMSFWLLTVNVFSFDYSGGVGVKFPASLSTNAALMASTVLASRLPSTNQVFSLTLFSIEVFGLFPVFRRYVRHRSWRYHMLLTILLVLGAGFGIGLAVAPGHAHPERWPWRSGLVGMTVGVSVAALTMGGCSWWLIGLQKYKNEIRGPWDQARPIIMSRPRWDDK